MIRTAIVEVLRDAAWFNARRAKAYLIILAVISALAAVGAVLISRQGFVPHGHVVGPDFTSFWSASKLALGGHPEQAWNVQAHRAVQTAYWPDSGYAAFFYPPPFLLICLPLALAPYMVSLGLWLAATGAAWMRMVRVWGEGEIGWLAMLAFPAVLLNAGHGQNAFLVAALLGAGALLAPTRPWLAGVLLGSLIIKPHFAVLVPLFLIFTRNWKSFVAAGVAAAGLCLLSWALFGTQAWLGFLAVSPLARAALEQNLVGFAKMQSVYAAVRLIGAPSALAWTVQVLAAAAAIFALWKATRGGSARAGAAALVCATLLTTPFVLDYDFTLLAVPLAWLFVQARRTGFMPWEKTILLIAFVLPIVARLVGTLTHVALAPWVVAALLWCVLRRARPPA
jgi:alpha-1,2-mannosyltransferase